MAAVDSWPKIILFGDSISQYSFSADGCWGTLLADQLQRKCDVLNRGFSGYNVRWCSYLLPQLVTEAVAKDTAAITIFLGANDSNDKENIQHVPMDEYKERLEGCVDHLLSVGLSRDKIIFISPPAFNAAEWEKECIKKGRKLTKSNKTTGEYAKACVAVAKTCGTEVVDLYTIMMQNPKWKECLNDGLHLSAAGSQLLFKHLQPIIQRLTADIPVKFPFWDQIDGDNLMSSLVPIKHE